MPRNPGKKVRAGREISELRIALEAAMASVIKPGAMLRARNCPTCTHAIQDAAEHVDEVLERHATDEHRLGPYKG